VTPPTGSPPSPKPDVNPIAVAASSVAGIDPGSSADEIAKNNEQLRATLQKIGAGLGAVATAVLGAVGFTRADAIFPLPAGHEWLGVAAAVAAGLAVFCSAAVVYRLFAAQRPIAIGSDLGGVKPGWIFHGDFNWIRDQAKKQTVEQGEQDLYSMDLRANRLARIALWLDPGWTPKSTPPDKPTPDQRLASFARLESEWVENMMRCILLRIGGGLLARRAERAFGSKRSVALLALAVGGTAWTFAVGDWAKGQRSLGDVVTITHTQTTQTGGAITTVRTFTTTTP
jgi:hypothetical protein